MDTSALNTLLAQAAQLAAEFQAMPNSAFLTFTPATEASDRLAPFPYVSTPKFKFYFSCLGISREKIIKGKCEEIFKAIGNEQTATLSALLQEPDSNVNISADVNMFTLKGMEVTLMSLRPLSTAALIGSLEMVKALLKPSDVYTLQFHLEDFHPYNMQCHQIILQHIEDSSQYAAVEKAYKAVKCQEDSTEKQQRVQELEQVYVGIRLNACLSVKNITQIVKDYLF